MTRQRSTHQNRRANGARSATERSAANRSATEADPSAGAGEGPSGEEWADKAAQARTASDPRRVTPHDRSGVPSTGDNR